LNSYITLNPEQLNAVKRIKGKLLIIGGPGTGKTEVALFKIAHLVEKEDVDPSSILTLTFTRSGAKFLRDRVATLIKKSFFEIPIQTFQSFCYEFIKRHYNLAGYSSLPKLMVSTEQKQFVKKILSQQDFSKYPLTKSYFKRDGFIQELFDFILRSQESLLSPSDLKKITPNYKKPEMAELTHLYKIYLDDVKKENLIDFGGLLYLTIDILRKEPLILKEIQKRYSHIIVDEFQESNIALMEFINLFFDSCESITLIGDDDQSIFGFRGAIINNIRNIFKKFYPYDVIFLKEGYRCPKDIFMFSQKLISNDTSRIEKPFTTKKENLIDSSVISLKFPNFASESNGISQFILKFMSEDPTLHFNEIAIIMRSFKGHIEILKSTLDRTKIPYQLIGGGDAIFKDPIVNAVISFLRILIINKDDERWNEEVKTVLLSDLFNLKPFTLRFIERYCILNNLKFSKLVFDKKRRPKLDKEEEEKIENFCRIYSEYSKKLNEPIDEIFLSIWKRIDYFNELVNKKDKNIFNEVKRKESIDAINRFFSSLKRFSQRHPEKGINFYLKSLEPEIGFIEEIETPKLDRLVDAVSIITAHQCKGKEFRIVFLPLMVEGIFPTEISIPQTYDKQIMHIGERLSREDLEKNHYDEERRLIYTSMTRASEKLIFSFSENVNMQERASPSRFLVEMDLVPKKFSEVEPYLGSIKSVESYFRSVATQSLEKLKETVDYELKKKVIDKAFLSIHILSKFGNKKSWWQNIKPTKNSNKPHPYRKLSASYSKVSTYKDCPAKYKFRYHFYVSETKGISLAKGLLYHKIIQEFFDPEKEYEYSIEKLKEIIDEVWDNTLFPYIPVADEQREEAYQSFKNLFNNLPPEKPEVLATEKEFSFSLDGNKFSGRIDQINQVEGGVELIDYKSSKTPIRFEDAKTDLQLGIYLLASILSPQLREIKDYVKKMYYFYIPQKNRTIREQEIGKNRIYQVKSEIKKLISKILNEKFDAYPRDFSICGYCEYKLICPRFYGQY
jgi:DNA helicase-2/ATP-dependent DNA helicase PcrA